VSNLRGFAHENLTGALGIFAVAGWSRTRSAFPRFERFSPAADAAVSDNSPAPDDPAVSSK
jgi:hypothetical protein